MQGWFKLHRCLMGKPIFDNPKLLKVFMWCLFKATYKKRETFVGVTKVELEPGQFVTGRFSAADELKMNGSTVFRYLKILAENQTIELKPNNKFTLVNIVNWANYQLEEEDDEQQMNNKRTTNEQQMNTNKNLKKGENINSNIAGKFIPPTVIEISGYCKERNNKVDAEKFHDFYQAKGWMVGKNKMKDWQASVRTWEKTDKDKPIDKRVIES